MRWIAFSAACLTLLACFPARAFIMVLPIPDRVAMADLIVVGKITAIEEQGVLARLYPESRDPVEFKVALVQVDQVLQGDKVNRIRLGFVPLPHFPDHAEAMYFLTRHHEQDFYVPIVHFGVVEKTVDTFDKFAFEVQRCARLLARPAEGLQSKNADDRLLTAAMLLVRYKANRGGKPNPRQEPIPTEESKLILEAIAAGDWSVRDRASPARVFYALELTPMDGWGMPKDRREYVPLAQKWLKENAGKYRILRCVNE